MQFISRPHQQRWLAQCCITKIVLYKAKHVSRVWLIPSWKAFITRNVARQTFDQTAMKLVEEGLSHISMQTCKISHRLCLLRSSLAVGTESCVEFAHRLQSLAYRHWTWWQHGAPTLSKVSPQTCTYSVCAAKEHSTKTSSSINHCVTEVQEKLMCQGSLSMSTTSKNSPRRVNTGLTWVSRSLARLQPMQHFN